METIGQDGACALVFHLVVSRADAWFAITGGGRYLCPSDRYAVRGDDDHQERGTPQRSGEPPLYKAIIEANNVRGRAAMSERPSPRDI